MAKTSTKSRTKSRKSGPVNKSDNNRKSNTKCDNNQRNRKGYGKCTGTAVPFPFNLLRF